MLAIFINVLAIIAGGFVGSITKRSLNVKYLNALATGMGIAILVMGINVAMQNMSKSDNPVLFIFCLAAGGLIGTMLNLDGKQKNTEQKVENRWRPFGGRRYYDSHAALLRGHACHDGSHPQRNLWR